MNEIDEIPENTKSALYFNQEITIFYSKKLLQIYLNLLVKTTPK